MRERAEPMMQTMKASEARQHWSQILNQVARRKARVIVEKSGIPVAAIISTEDLDHLSRIEAERAERLRVLDRVGAAFEDVPAEELEREVSRALAAVRTRRRPAKPGAKTP